MNAMLPPDAPHYGKCFFRKQGVLWPYFGSDDLTTVEWVANIGVC